ncbi:class I SAM-dependent methyltransferase [Kordiimonas pumila]|uniref:Class I SAM-dependent methyltransferase n=1 Tax=Kordiimonas pumila TaxID=2161677 RepID=A0ABV7D1V1_9PROT|nr:methyltransferase domain-containing protein [Kordiimonas pumila]
MIKTVLKTAVCAAALVVASASMGTTGAQAQQAANKPHATTDHLGIQHLLEATKDPRRSLEDRGRDLARKPLKVLRFVGIQPGMTVVDLNSGGGWYTEILSRAVGESGKVYAHNGPVYWNFVKDNTAKRYGGGRLPNVTLLHEGTEELIGVPEASVDVVMTVLAYHDYWYNNEARMAPEDIPAILASIHKALKPGGAFVVVDHVAPAGSGTEAGDKYHRIDPAIVKEQVLAAGFAFAGESDALANPDDDHIKSPFDPSIRGKTDRFIFKFVK